MADYMDHDFTQYLNFGDDGSVAPETDNAMDLSTIPYQDRADYQAEQAPQNDEPRTLRSLAEYYDLLGPKAKAQALAEGESGGIPDLQRDNGSSVQKATHKNTTVSNLMNQLGSVLPQASADEMPPSAPQSQGVDPMAARQTQLDAAQADREQNMRNSVLRGASTDMLNSGLLAMGIDHRLKPGYGDERLNQMNDLKLKDLDQQMKLSGQVGAEEKAKIDLTDMAAMSDPNSPGSTALRDAASKFLGADKDPRMAKSLAGMSGRQIQNLLGDNLAGILSKMDAREQQDKQFNLRLTELRDSREARKEDKDRKDKSDAEIKLIRSGDNLPKISKAYERYQQIQPSVEYAKSLKNGDIAPDGPSDGALALQAIKIAQGDNSVVRSSDLEQFNKIGGLKQVLADARQSVLGGGRLIDSVRNAFINIILDSEKGIRKAAKQQTLGKWNEFQKSSVDPDFIPGTLKYIHETEDSTKSNKSKDQKNIVKKQYSPSRNKTKLIYSDGTEEILDGQQ